MPDNAKANDAKPTTHKPRLEQGNWHADDWSAVNDPENFLRLFNDYRRIALYMRDLRDLTVAAQRVTWLRYGGGDDPDNILVKNHPRLAAAIFQLGNLVGVANPNAPTGEKNG
jgi:hypothetical protein